MVMGRPPFLQNKARQDVHGAGHGGPAQHIQNAVLLDEHGGQANQDHQHGGADLERPVGLPVAGGKGGQMHG